MTDVNGKRKLAQPPVPLHVFCVMKYKRNACEYNCIENPATLVLMNPCCIGIIKNQHRYNEPEHAKRPNRNSFFTHIAINLVRETSAHEQRYFVGKETIAPGIPAAEFHRVHVIS